MKNILEEQHENQHRSHAILMANLNVSLPPIFICEITIHDPLFIYLFLSSSSVSTDRYYAREEINFISVFGFREYSTVALISLLSIRGRGYVRTKFASSNRYKSRYQKQHVDGSLWLQLRNPTRCTASTLARSLIRCRETSGTSVKL